MSRLPIRYFIIHEFAAMKKRFTLSLLIVLTSFAVWGQENNLLPLEELEYYQLYTSLEEALADKENVLRLSLTNQDLSYLPKELYQLDKLQELRLNGNKLKSYPDSLKLLTGLQVLDLSWTGMEKLPAVVGQMTQLRKLDL